MHRVHHSFKTVMRSEFFVNAVQVIPQRRQRDTQVARNLRRILAFSEQPQNPAFLIREGYDWSFAFDVPGSRRQLLG